ncbi:MAG: hypothetical protein HDR03_14980 [Lachnospiraceae bacterium]|nr:hypothetical protein [Lachnospiraceae bacterium]
MWINSYFPFMIPCWGKLTEKKLTEFENSLDMQNTIMELVNLACNSIHFTGLPETCNERYFKLCLILSGRAMIAKDSELGFISLNAVPDGKAYNIYGETEYVYGYGWNGFNKLYTCYMYGTDNTDAEAVICRDNNMMYPIFNYILLYAQRLSSTMRTLDVTARKLKTPYFIVCDESQKSSVKKILDDIDFNRDAIITNKSATPNMFEVLPTNVREGALQSLWNHYNNLESQIRSILGIQSAVNQDKKERLLVDEVTSNNEMADLNLDVRLENYKLFCETVNKQFGLNIDVELNDYLQPVIEDNTSINDKLGGGNDEE